MLRRAATPPSAAVVIVLSHRTSYIPDEEISFRHVRHHLGRYDTYVLIPESHQGIYPGLIPARFPDRWFTDRRAIDALLLSERFYRTFLAYEFVLVHHLDALILSDQMGRWCAAGFDYVGGPSLSLRRVGSFLRVLSSRRYSVEPDEYWRRYVERTPGRVTRAVNTPRKHLARWLPFNGVRSHIRSLVRDGVPERQFWTTDATHYDPPFRVAAAEASRRFAFDADPRQSFEQAGRRMPFGAHRWTAFDRSFYAPGLLRHGLGSEVRLRAAREARAWGELEIAAARLRSIL